MLGYWPYATHKNIFYIFLSKTQASQLIAIKDNKPCAYILRIYKKTEQSKKNQGWPLEAKQKLFFFYLFWTGSSPPYGLDQIQPDPTRLLAQTSNQFCHCCMHMHATVAKVINLAKKGKERLTCEAVAGGEVEGDDWALLTKDDPARCSQWRQICQLKDDRLNDGPLVLLRSVQTLQGREGCCWRSNLWPK